MKYPFDRLKQEHRQHYREGTLEEFVAWFERSGFADMLANPWLNDGPAQERRLVDARPDFAKLKAVRYCNEGTGDASLAMQVHIERGASSLQQLFANFVRCTGHTHLPGDFRHHIDFFASSYTGPRFVLFDGAGTCLLLGAMFQALARNLRNEEVQLHYSHTARRELTHVFASWQGNFVDLDQKTWVPMSQIDDSAVFGYLFQQFGVSAYQVFLGMDPEVRQRLFSRMNLDYFTFYDDSRTQYMYQREQSTTTVSEFFRQAREKHCSDLDISADDFPWKAAMRAKTEAMGLQLPYFLADLAQPVLLTLPAGASFSIGLDAELPLEAEQLSSIFLGRVPGALRLALHGEALTLKVPEMPWMLVFGPDVRAVQLNGCELQTWPSGCGRYRLLGAGDIEPVLALPGRDAAFELRLRAAALQCALVFPVNAFALASGLVDITVDQGSRVAIYAQSVQ